jgi:pimeloyl-ACP methyl ester carboxylesterase
VVLVSGLDISGSLSWTAVHDSIARTSRTCAYSRAGIMWSDPGPDVTARGVAEDLHAALEKAGEKPPFVMVGHSLGGPYIMTYTKQFGDQVAGVVMVDASHPDQLKTFKPIAPAAAEVSLTPLKIEAALGWTGILRLQLQKAPAMPHQEMDGVRASAAYASSSIAGALKEAKSLGAILDEAGTLRQLGDRPLVVLTAMMPMSPAERAALKVDDEKAKAFKQAWKTLHDDEASWSSRSQHILVDDASHYIQFFRPDLVIAAVRSVVDSVHAASAIAAK